MKTVDSVRIQIEAKKYATEDEVKDRICEYIKYFIRDNFDELVKLERIPLIDNSWNDLFSGVICFKKNNE